MNQDFGSEAYYSSLHSEYGRQLLRIYESLKSEKQKILTYDPRDSTSYHTAVTNNFKLEARTSQTPAEDYSIQVNHGNIARMKSEYEAGQQRLTTIDTEISDALEAVRLYELSLREAQEQERKNEHDRASNEAQIQRDHEREMKIIAHETARENRLAAEATAKVAATAQEQASQSLDGLLKGLQGNE